VLPVAWAWFLAGRENVEEYSTPRAAQLHPVDCGKVGWRAATGTVMDLPLSPSLLVRAYAQGLFPMARGPRGPIDWYSPDPRAVLPLSPPEAFHISHSLRQRVKRGAFLVTFDRAFERVIRACAQPRPYEKSTWINGEIIRAYCGLHGRGLAHSVEVWTAPPPDGAPLAGGAPSPAEEQGCVLAGGLYGVALGGAFFGESMFSRATDASKVCLVHLVEHLRQRGYVLLDTQISNAHMAQFGVVEIPRADYLRRLAGALELPAQW
jgi:leucyl/phenylalanyl-tRNA---protein transferase